MKRLLFLFLLLPVLIFGQLYSINTPLFRNPNTLVYTDTDSLASISVPDSVEIQMGFGGPWKLLTVSVNDTAMITVDDILAETRVVFDLAAETWWTHINEVRFRIFATGVDTLTSFWIPTQNIRGALTLDVVPDTVAGRTAVYFTQSILHGN